MREHLSSLHGSMVLALLNRTKTCTRRLVKCDNSFVDGERWTKAQWATLDWSIATIWSEPMSDPCWYVRDEICRRRRVTPRVQPGDVLAFREALVRDGDRARYAADRTDPQHPTLPMEPYPWPWKRDRIPPMFCPRDAIRLRREVVSVLPSVPMDVTTEDEARAEGLNLDVYYRGDLVDMERRWTWRGPSAPKIGHESPREAYAALLAHVHGRPVPETAPCWRYGFAELPASGYLAMKRTSAGST